VPNMRKAAGFAVELEPQRMMFLNNGELPFGAHQWDRYDPGLRERILEINAPNT